MVVERIDAELKKALLAGQKERVTLLRGLKSAIQYETVSLGVKEQGLNEDQAQKVLAREAKKRQESADLYAKAGENERANIELQEKEAIEKFLPRQLSEVELLELVRSHVSRLGAASPADMGKVIGAVKSDAGAGADGATIARLTKEVLGELN